MEKENEECCPEGEPCEVPVIEEAEPEEVKHVNPYEVPYIPSSHVQKLIAKKKARDKKLKRI